MIPKRVQILKELKKRPKKGSTVWELNQKVYTNDSRKRVSELIRNDGIEINKVNREDGHMYYVLKDPEQPEVAALLTRYGA